MTTSERRSQARVAVVTGASGGIGAATARRLVRTHGFETILVARREQELEALAAELGERASYVAVDLTADDAPERVRAAAAERGRLDLLVNNAGGSRRATFAEGGVENVRRTMALNFDAALRMTEALLPLLRESAPSAVVNVASVAGRVARARTGAYSASKAALIAWTDALQLEESPHGVHVAAVLPGFIQTEGFPAEELVGRALTRWLVSQPDVAAQAIVDTALERRGERFVPRYYAVAAYLRVLAPGIIRRVLSGGGADAFTTRTAAD